MRLGALFAPLAPDATPRRLAEQARRFVGAGFESIWSAQAIGRGFMLSDPFVALAVAATVTDAVEIGTAVLQVPLYAPADLAHRVLSLMQICGDRLSLGIGAGSTDHDFAAFGRDYERRFGDFTTATATLRRLLSDGRCDGVDLSPWSSVRGGPPLLLGSWGRGVERAARSFDGWIASAAYRTSAEVISALQRYRTAGGARAIVSTIQLGPRSDPGQTRERLAEFAAAGFDDAIVMLLPGGPSPESVRALL